MPPVLSDPTLSGAVTAAAVAAAPHLPGAPEAHVVEGTDGALVLPGADALGVAVRLTGAVHGSLVLLVAAAEAAPLLSGPLAATGPIAALEPALQDAVEALRGGVTSPVQVEACRAVDATVALDLAASADATAVVQLLAGDAHVATLVLAIDAPSVPAPRRGGAPVRSDAPDPLRLQLLHDVPMGVTVQLGSTRMTVRELLALSPGSLVELDRAAGSPVDVLVNGTLLARGEVVVVDEEYAVRISEIVSTPVDRSGRS